MPHVTRLLYLHFSSLFLSFALSVCFLGTARAQSALDGFDPNANGTVRVVVVQPDGKILIGGDFTSLAPNGGASVTRNRIARLNPDGTLDTGFNPNANGTVYAISLQTDGKILVGGAFNGPGGIGGQLRNRIARLDATTGLADSFDPNSNGDVNAIVLQTDGKILAGGSFNGANSIGGQTRNRIARLDATTGLADSFDPNANGIVQCITLQADGKILVGGFFNGVNSIGGLTRNRIARLDAATGLADPFDPNANGQVYAIALQADGKVIVGGFFNGAGSIGGQARNYIARLDATTGLADSFNPNANFTVFALAAQADGKILVGGIFGDFFGPIGIGGQRRNAIARLDAATGLADPFDPNPNNGSSAAYAIAVQADRKILAGGTFSTIVANGGAAVTRNNIARLETDGRADQTLDLNIGPFSPTNIFLEAIAIQPDGKILIGGSFNQVLGVQRNHIARLNTDGTLDTAFNPSANADVRSIAVQPDGRILVGGDFFGPNSIGGQTRNRIARLDPVTGLADSFNPNANSTVLVLAVQSDGKILVGGSFNGPGGIGGQTRNRIARLDATTGLADSFNPDANSPVTSIVVQEDGKILAGGTFNGANSIGGQTRNRIARLDPTTGLADSFDPNANSDVYSIAVQAGGKILVGGNFNGANSIGGQTRNYIARLDATSGVADSFDPNANGDVYSIAVNADGKILAGGGFNGANSIGGQTRNRIARLDATTGLADSFNPDANNAVTSIAVQADGKILAGGNFRGPSSISGQTRSLFARLSNDTPAQQHLVVTQTAVTWTLSGSSPQFTRVTFEDSTDGMNYNFLGIGTPTGSNWTLTGLNLSVGQNLYIRARGYSRSGMYNGSESITESVRNAFLSAAPLISGTVTYGNAASPPKYISNVLVTGTGSPSVFTTTAAPGGTAGQYTLTGFGAGSYTVSLSKTTGQNSITSNDAARIAQHVSGSNLLNTTQKVVADVSNNGVVSSFDAAQIATFVASGSSPGIAGQWRFFVPPGPTFPVGASPTSRTYPPVTSNITGDDYIGLLIGEVTGNWTPTAARPAGIVESGKLKVESEDGGPERSVAVELPTLTASSDKEIIVPVNVQGIANKGVISYEFDLRYDASVIQPQEDPVDVAGTVSRGLSVVTNATEPGLLRVVVYGAFPIDENGVLLNLRFTAVGGAGLVSPISFERIMFNEGEPRVSIANGKVELF